MTLDPDAAAPSTGSIPVLRKPARRRWPIVVAIALAIVVGLVVASYTGLLSHLPVGSGSSPLQVEIRSTPSIGYSPLNVEFTASVQGGTGPYSFAWTDGARLPGSTDAQFVTFDSPGNRTIGVTVTDAAGSNASASLPFAVVSPSPQARTLVPAWSSGTNAVLTIRWHASSSADACILASWGELDIPPFADCSAQGGLVSSGTSGAVDFQPDPDDPETTPVLFQSASLGDSIVIDWWFNDTSGASSPGSVALTTAVEPL